jgi:hypothetical protein
MGRATFLAGIKQRKPHAYAQELPNNCPAQALMGIMDDLACRAVPKPRVIFVVP